MQITFLSHHGVLKQSSLAIKLRVVYDVSSKRTNGLILNHILHVRSVIKNYLLSIVLRFRTDRYVLTKDIVQDSSSE
jgi:hypothetical protein